MAENKNVPGCVVNGLPGGHPLNNNFKEAVCINANKVYDSCKDKDCLEDLRVYLCYQDQSIVDNAINVKCKRAEIVWVYIDVEPVPFNRGFYTVDVKFFFKVYFDAFLGVGRPQEVCGLCTFDKKVILFGSEGNARVYSSDYKPQSGDPQNIVTTNMPKASVEVVDPICLGVKVVEDCHCCCCETDISTVPDYVCKCFDGELCDGENKKLLVSIGVFSIIRIERNVQLLVPAYDFCIPEKECTGGSDQKPCDLFDKINFPLDEFFPPQIRDFNFDQRPDNGGGCNCGCGR